MMKNPRLLGASVGAMIGELVDGTRGMYIGGAVGYLLGSFVAKRMGDKPQ